MDSTSPMKKLSTVAITISGKFLRIIMYKSYGQQEFYVDHLSDHPYDAKLKIVHHQQKNGIK